MTTAAIGKGLADATRRIEYFEDEKRDEIKRHKRQIEALDRRIQTAREQRDLILAGASLDVIRLAETLIEVTGREHAGVGDGPKVIANAIRALANGGRTTYPNGGAYEIDLFTRYLGTKNYEGWNGQAEGGSYGSSPRHGTLIFTIGFRPEYRGDGEKPTEEQLDAAIAYLHALLRRPT